ncbi:hypothetical protein PGT21_004030 [Puccinia graminis f. sp. tritici]|uniref:Uncharacterized protein n=1 Tax=Puccinia graminis f. sp. tritici TaxID=56615 RepID=A0A5B0N300_PUCGR|nr:hypothetical protein PGT21_004030 [Puccinia graminis f. sp. tritici]
MDMSKSQLPFTLSVTPESRPIGPPVGGGIRSVPTSFEHLANFHVSPYFQNVNQHRKKQPAMEISWEANLARPPQACMKIYLPMLGVMGHGVARPVIVTSQY